MKKSICLLLLTAARLFAVNPVPYTEGVDFSFKIDGTGSASINVYDETGSQYVLATASGSTIESSPGTAWLRPGKVYNVEFWGLGPPDYWMSFNAPIGYTVFIDGVETSQSGASPGSGWFLHYHTVEIRSQSTAVGGMWGSFSGIALGKSITWSVGLGDLRTGRSAGAIEFKELDLSNAPNSRDRLFYAAPPANVGQIVVVKDGPSNQTLKQIVTPIGFTDIVDVTGGYEIRCYPWSQVASWTGYYYTFSGSPWKTIKVESPASNQLKITETEGSVVRVSNLVGSGSTTETGGTITYNGSYTQHTFTSGGTLTLGSAHSGVSWLVIGGGGGGGTSGGGGGAGSMEYFTGQSLSAGSYSAVVGAGGASDTNGNNSTFNGTTGYGGGRGASNVAAPGSGGSSGGGCANNNTGGPPNSGSGSNIHWGGNGDNGGYGWRGGGGGGAGQNGHGVGEGSSTGYGGNGLANSISGSSVVYGGGGAGGSNGGPGLPGGSGGGGSGVASGVGGNGAANKGAGGAAGDGAAGGSGGSGIVIVSYPTPTMTWTLQEGDGSTWLRTTTHTSTSPASGQRDDVAVVRTGGTSGTIVAKTKYHYVTQAWGEELDSIIADPDTAALTTTYTYWTTSTDLGNYRRVKSITAPTGNWTAYQYYDDYATRGELKYEYHPYLDTPSTVPSTLSTTSGRVIYFTYTSDWTGRNTRPTLRQESVNGTVVAQTTWSHGDNTGSGEPRAYATINSYRDASNYQSSYSEVYRADADPDFAGQFWQQRNANLTQVSGSISRGTFNTTTKAFAVGSSGDHWRELRFNGTCSSTGADAVSFFDYQYSSTVYMVPNKSTLDVTIRIAQGYVYRTEKWVYTGSGAFSLMTAEDFEYDGYGHLTQRWASTGNGALTSYSYTNGRLTSVVDPTGTETQYTYDLIGRVATTIKKGAAASGSYAAQGDITTTNTYNGAGQVTQTVVSGGALSQTTTAAYDLAGRITSSVAPGSYTTSFAYSSAGKIVTATLPGGATRISEVYLDGQPKSQTGTAVVAQYTGFTVNSSPGTITRQDTFGTSTSTALVKTTADWLGRQITEVKPGWNGSDVTKSWTYDGTTGQLIKLTQPGLADTLYAYDTLGSLVREGLDVGANGSLDLSSSDRITDHDWTYFSSSGWWRRETTKVYATSSSSTTTQVGKVEAQLSGLATNRLSLTNTTDIYGNVTSQYVDVSRSGKTVTSTTDVPNSTTDSVQIAYNGLLMSARDTANITTTYGYDALGRPVTSVDPRTGTTTTAYVSGTSQVYTVTDPASIVQATYTYDSAGRVATVTNALSKVCRYDYTARNESYRVWGDTDYPVEYAYDNWGHRTTMKTYRGGSSWTGSTWPSSPGTADTTTWAYQEATGLLSSKTDASSKVVSYTYTQSGQMATRLWARILTGSTHLTTSYSYSSTTAELTGVSYNDSTPALTYTYNRLGKQDTVIDGTGTRTFAYNLAGTLELQYEDLPSFYDTRRVGRGYDTSTGTVGRYNRFYVTNSSHAYDGYDESISYDSYGRLNSIFGAFNYTYTSNSNLITSVTNTAWGWNYTDTRTYNSQHDWVAQRTFVIGSATKASFAYTQDNMGRVTQTAKTGEVFNRYGNGTEGLTTYYGYDDRSQLTSEVTKVGTSSTVLAGRNDSGSGNDGYAYDNIGNRTATKHNSSSTSAAYTVNALNQYTQRAVIGAFDVAGSDTASTVTVARSGGPTDTAARNGNYFFDAYALTNTSNSVYTNLTITGSGSATLPAYVEKTPQALAYDDDGNLTSDGRWNYTYDAENRLIAAETTSAAVTAGVTRQKLTFANDYLGRRISKMVQSGWSGSSYANTDLSLRFIYDGWNPVMELNALSSLAKARVSVWGLDLSGTLQGAGGVGGLLYTYDYSTSGVYLPAYDAMGNIHAMINPGGTIAAAYEYDAFGNALRESGTYAASNPFRYSTKYTDIETSLVYYGLRYYSPTLGRFINKDPTEEKGGLNLYAFCRNNAVNGYDILGQWPTWWINPVHQNSIGRVYPGASPDQLAAMNAGQLWVDSFQDTSDSYMHAQRFAGQSASDARAQTNTFISSMLDAAHSSVPGSSDYWFYVSAASHAPQDHTAPPHQNESVWRGTGDLVSMVLALFHVAREAGDPGAGSDLDLATQFIKEHQNDDTNGKDWLGDLDKYITDQHQAAMKNVTVVNINSAPAPDWMASSPVATATFDASINQSLNNAMEPGQPRLTQSSVDAMANTAAGDALLNSQKFAWLNKYLNGSQPAGMLPGQAWLAYANFKAGNYEAAEFYGACVTDADLKDRLNLLPQ